MTKTPDQIRIKIDGKGVSPETVRASDLAEFLINFEKAILETALAKGEVSPEGLERDVTVSLVEVSTGSEALTFALTGPIVPSAGLLSTSVATGSFVDVPYKAQSALHEISKQAIKRGWMVEFLGDKEKGIDEAKISVANPVPPPRVGTARGETTIYGRLIRVGGMKPRAMILLPDDNYIYVDLSESMAVELASKERLYKEIGLDGLATWRTDTWEILEFRARRVTGYQAHKTNIVETFEALAAIDGERWAGVDADQYIAEMRGRTIP